MLHIVTNAFDFWLYPFLPVPYNMTGKQGEKMFLKITIVLYHFKHCLKIILAENFKIAFTNLYFLNSTFNNSVFPFIAVSL